MGEQPSMSLDAELAAYEWESRAGATSFTLGDEGMPAEYGGAVICIGVFDGFHRGHADLIGRTCAKARSAGRACIVLTFDADPDCHFGKPGMRKLMSDDARIGALARSGVDAVASMRVDDALLGMEPEAFLNWAFGKAVPSAVFVGEDFRFGRKASGTVASLAGWCAGHGAAVHPVRLLAADGSPVTATRIRGLLSQGSLDQANELLGHPFEFSSEIGHGRGQGASFGFATANLMVDPLLNPLKDGVYCGVARLADEPQRTYRAAISWGASPTFKDASPCEVHLLGFEGSLYGRTLEVRFLERRRDMIKFDSQDELIRTVSADIEYTRTFRLRSPE